MTRHRTAAVFNPLSDMPRRESKVVGVKFDDAEHFSGVTVYFDDGSRLFSHVGSPDAGIELDTLVSRLDSRLRAQDVIDCIEYLFNTASSEMSREEMLDLVEAALDEAHAKAEQIQTDDRCESSGEKYIAEPFPPKEQTEGLVELLLDTFEG